MTARVKRELILACALTLSLGATGVPDAAQAAGSNGRPATATAESGAQQGEPGYAQRMHDALTQFIRSQLACGRHGDPWVLATAVGALVIINLMAVLTPPSQATCTDREKK
jgi:hypothetical protein